MSIAVGDDVGVARGQVRASRTRVAGRWIVLAILFSGFTTVPGQAALDTPLAAWAEPKCASYPKYLCDQNGGSAPVPDGSTNRAGGPLTARPTPGTVAVNIPSAGTVKTATGCNDKLCITVESKEGAENGTHITSVEVWTRVNCDETTHTGSFRIEWDGASQSMTSNPIQVGACDEEDLGGGAAEITRWIEGRGTWPVDVRFADGTWICVEWVKKSGTSGSGLTGRPCKQVQVD